MGTVNWLNYLAVFGVGTLIYCMAKLIYCCILERQSKGKKGMVSVLLGILAILLCVVSLPASLILFAIDKLHSKRFSAVFNRHIIDMRRITTDYTERRFDKSCAREDLDTWRREEYQKAGLDDYL